MKIRELTKFRPQSGDHVCIQFLKTISIPEVSKTEINLTNIIVSGIVRMIMQDINRTDIVTGGNLYVPCIKLLL